MSKQRCPPRCSLDLDTRWEGTYKGILCGLEEIKSADEYKLVEKEKTIVIVRKEPGVYEWTSEERFGGLGIAYIDINGNRVLQIVNPNIEGGVFFKYAKKLHRHKVTQFLAPDALPNLPGGGLTDVTIYKRVYE